MSIKVAAAVWALLGFAESSALAAVIKCPYSLNKHLFGSVSLFDGDPAGLADMIPIEGRWDVSKPATEGWFLVCRYRGTKETKTFRVPDGVKFCDIDGFCR